MDVRASDADRQRVAATLQRHTEAGRLTLEEFTERVGTVYAARTVAELAAATADLPTDGADHPHGPAGAGEQHDGRQLAVAFAIALVAIVALFVLYGLLS